MKLQGAKKHTNDNNATPPAALLLDLRDSTDRYIGTSLLVTSIKAFRSKAEMHSIVPLAEKVSSLDSLQTLQPHGSTATPDTLWC